MRVSGHGPNALRAGIDRGPVLVIDHPWRSPRSLLRVRLALLLPVLLFAFSLYQNLGNMDTVDFHRDEARWINRAYFLEELARPFSNTWADYYTTRGQPPLGNYLMGVGLLLQGRDLETNRVWDFTYDEGWNDYAGAFPTSPDLNAGRRTNAVLGALVVVCVYMLTSLLTNRTGGFAAGLFLALHPLHLRLSSQALSDQLLTLLLVLSFLAAFRFAQKPTLGWGLVLGVLLGLGGATKLSPLLLSLPLAGFGALWLASQAVRHGRPGLQWRKARLGWLLAVQPVIAFAAFVVVNPFLWPDPIRRSYNLFDFRRVEMDLQSTAWPVAGVESPMAALARTGRRFHEDYSTSMRIQHWAEQTVTGTFGDLSLDVVLMCAGAIGLVAIVVRAGISSPQMLAALLMAAECGAVIAGMGVDFYRYFLPLLVIGSVCVGVAAGAAFDIARAHVDKSRRRRSARPTATG